MNVESAFSYIFQDPNWVKKMLIGGGITLVGVLFFWLLLIPPIIASILITGYTLAVTRNVANDETLPLPEWTELGALFSRGLGGIGGNLLLSLPAILLGVCSAGINIIFSGGIGGARSSADALPPALLLIQFCLSCIVVLYSIAISLYIYAPQTRYALEGRFPVYWDFRGNFEFIKRNVSGYLIAWALSLVAGFVGGLGFLACGVGLFFTAFYAQLVIAHLFGQFARGKSLPALEPPVAPAPELSPA